MMRRALQLVRPWGLSLNVGDAIFRLVLLSLIAITLCVLVYVKASGSSAANVPLLFVVYSFFVTTFALSRIVSAMFYRQSYDAAIAWGAHNYSIVDEYEPLVSFVIPCKNEEAIIARTIEQCFAAEYPAWKKEVIVINDGSDDRTFDEIVRMKEKYPELIAVHWTQNRGKRHGMAEGFRRAHGEIVIQLDSDSHLDPRSLRAIVEPFRNPDIGALCAHAEPTNADKNLLTRMQAAYYFFSFRVLKAAESTYQVVFCCSGCASAYRREAVMPIIEDWVGERFWGLPCTWGDDRALTTWVIKRGYRTIYADTVKAFTVVPEKFKQLIKQQIRWKKSWLVNAVFTGKFIWKREPFVAFTYFFPLMVVTFMTPFMAARALFYAPIVTGMISLYYVGGILLLCTIMVLYYRWVARENRYWPYLYGWAVLTMVLFSFLLIYALATIQNRRWGTR
jgi:hyaluronan synthase